MVVSEKSLKKLRDFLATSLKVKHRFSSLESFHDYANELEIAEFYEENSEFLLLFMFECYLLMIGKTWIRTEDSGGKETIEYAFGKDAKLPSVLDIEVTDEEASETEKDKEKSVEPVELEESKEKNEVPVAVSKPSKFRFIEKLSAQCQRVRPVVDSNFQATWVNSLKKDANAEVYLKFPVIFSKLLQYVSINRILSSPLASFLLGMIKRLLQVDNLAILRVEGLKMLLNLLKAASHDSSHEVTKSCTEIFSSLIDIEVLLSSDGSGSVPVSLSEGGEVALIKATGIEGVNLDMLNEILSFMTWDLNPDLHSTRFLYNLLRDNFLIKIFPIADQKSKLSLDEFDKNVRGNVLEMIVDYFALWFLKSSKRTYKFGSSLMNSTEDSSFKNRFGSMVSLVVNDLSNFLGVGGSSQSSTGSKKHSRSSMINGEHKNESPIASFLLEEVILGSPKDVILVHYILKSACFTLSFSSNLFCIRLTLEIFRSWLFNPVARRPQFLQNLDELDGYVAFYMDALEGLYPHRHMKSPADTGNYEDLQATLVDRVDVYKEGIYFYRALALQAFFSMSFERWIHLLSIEISVVDLLLDPDNQVERTYFTTEDALLAETLLGSLMRSSEHFSESEAMRKKWLEISKVLTKCASSRGIIEEWCRVIESLAVLLVRDPRYSGCFDGASISRASSLTSALSLANSPTSGSTSSLPPINFAFSAWPDLPAVRQNAVVLFRNMLRILGDPASSLLELRNNRPDLMALTYESMDRCLDILIKCRSEQPVKIPMKNVPPLGDFLPTALSALLHLKSYMTIISSKQSDDPTDITSVNTAHDASRIIAWKMVGVIMFRPADLKIPDHYWGALLVALRESLNVPLSAAEFTSIMLHVGIPVSSAQIPGTTVILSEMIDGMLRFFNDTLWSGNSVAAFSASEASVLIPVTVEIISNSLKLAQMFPEQFGHFRDETCLIRLIKMLIKSISDPNLLTIIHTTLAEIYCSEVVGAGEEDFDFAQSILELTMEGPFKFSGGKSHVHVVVCLSEYFSALAHLKIADPSNKLINCDFIVQKLIECIEIGDQSKEDFSEALVRIVQGPLSDWILYVYQGKLRDAGTKTRVCNLINLRFISFKSVRVALDQFAMRLLTLSAAFPSISGPEFIGSEGLNSESSGDSLLNLVLTPSQTILSFHDQGNGEILVTARNSIAKFKWKMRDLWAAVDPSSDVETETQTLKIISPFKAVLKDSDFLLPKAAEGSLDVLKDLLSKIKGEFPESFVKTRSILVNSDEKWKEQKEHEISSKFQVDKTFSEFSRFEAKRPVYKNGRISSRLRLLLSSLSLTHPGFGVQILRSESSTGGQLAEEFKQLDDISGRFKIKIACMKSPAGLINGSDLFNHVDTPEEECEEYNDFLSSLMDADGKLLSPTIEFEVDELGKMKQQELKNKTELKKYLGNDSVLIIWHGKEEGTLITGAPFRSEVTSAIIRIRSHSTIPGWYQVTLQTCYERLVQPRKYARVKVDPFTLANIDCNLDLEVDGVFELAPGSSVQRGGILVPMGSLGAMVRALSCAAWRQSYVIDCLRSASAPPILSAENRVRFAPESVRRGRIEEITKRHGMTDLPYDQYISSLFQA